MKSSAFCMAHGTGHLEIVTASQAASRPESLLVLIGGPNANSLVEKAVSKKQAKFSDLKVDSFLLWRVPVGKKRGLIVGGNDEAATMYAAYDLVERLGVTFLLAKDILPEKTADLKLPAANVRAETPFPRRGLLISNIYPNRGIMNLAEVKSMLDQMAKLKMNFLQFFWFEHEPWINFGYRGENKLLGDATGKETGYLTWRYNYGSNLIKDVVVGQNLFGGRERMAPMEFQKVETPEDAFRVAQGVPDGDHPLCQDAEDQGVAVRGPDDLAWEPGAVRPPRAESTVAVSSDSWDAHVSGRSRSYTR